MELGAQVYLRMTGWLILYWSEGTFAATSSERDFAVSSHLGRVFFTLGANFSPATASSVREGGQRRHGHMRPAERRDTRPAMLIGTRQATIRVTTKAFKRV